MAATAASTGHLQLASLSWFLYDWAIRLAKEVDYLRTHQWSFTKALYVFIRYITLALLVGETVVSVRVKALSQTRCTTFVSVRTAGTFVILIAAFGAAQSCISKLYNGSRRVRRANAALCAVAVIVAVVLEGIFSARNHDVSDTSCFTLTPRTAAVSWIAPLCFTLYMLILAALKFPSQSEGLGLFEYGALPQLFGSTCLPWLALLPASLLTLILLRAAGSASVVDGGLSLVQAAAAISATRLLTGNTTSSSDVASLLDPQPARPSSAHFELGSMRHRAKDSYWSQQETLVTAISPRSAVFPADAIAEEFEFPKKRSSRLPTPISPDDSATVTLDLETEHARSRALLVSAIVTRAELPYDLELGDGDDDSSFNIVDGAEMTGMSPDRDAPPRRFSAASLRAEAARRNSSRASLAALSREIVESG